MTLWNEFKVYILVWDHLLGSIKAVIELSSGENGHQIQKDSSSGDKEYALGV